METFAAAELWGIRVLLLYGILIGAWFLITWMPRVPKKMRWTLPAIDSGSWVAAVLVAYVVIFAEVIFSSIPNDNPHVVVQRGRFLLIFIAVDLVLSTRAFHWYRLRKKALTDPIIKPDAH